MIFQDDDFKKNIFKSSYILLTSWKNSQESFKKLSTSQEEIEVTGSKLPDFTTVRRPDITELKQKFDHAKDKMFYKVASNEYTIHLILGDSTYSKIRTETVLKGKAGDPIVEETSFGWIMHGGERYTTDYSMYTRENNICEQLYNLDVLGVEDRGVNDQLQVLTDFE